MSRLHARLITAAIFIVCQAPALLLACPCPAEPRTMWDVLPVWVSALGVPATSILFPAAMIVATRRWAAPAHDSQYTPHGQRMLRNVCVTGAALIAGLLVWAALIAAINHAHHFVDLGSQVKRYTCGGNF